MRIVSTGPRQSGRTFRQLAALPNNSVFVVGNQPMVKYTREMLNRNFPEKNIRIVSIETAKSVCWMGMNLAGVDVDHAVVLDRGDEIATLNVLYSRVGRHMIMLTTSEAAALHDYLGSRPMCEVAHLLKIWEKLK